MKARNKTLNDAITMLQHMRDAVPPPEGRELSRRAVKEIDQSVNSFQAAVAALVGVIIDDALKIAAEQDVLKAVEDRLGACLRGMLSSEEKFCF